jgi:beta-fructofuranosidase
MQASDGRRLLVGWMGVPDGEEMLQPTRAHGWIHQMTCLRELELSTVSSTASAARADRPAREAHGWRERPAAGADGNR